MIDSFSLDGKRIWVAGHNGMVGSALVRRLRRENCEILTVDRIKLDLLDQRATRDWIARERPDAIFLSAARVGGILANDTFPADFIYDNLAIETNVIEAAHRSSVSKLLFLGSSCIYPRLARQPIAEEELLSGPLEPTNEWYAIAKIAGIKLCQAYRKQYGRNFISAMPTNLYGPGDDFDLNASHVIPSLIRKTWEAKRRGDPDLVIWGTGTPRREFLHVDDCADACIHLMKTYCGDSHINVGAGVDVTILELAKLVSDIVGFTGGIKNDLSKPDGAPQKLLNVEKLKTLGWKFRISLAEGLRETVSWFQQYYQPLLSADTKVRP